ncbi:MAG: hypothetical protein BEN19_01455 [Epulopiscium sp. Nuni2H_MBin003]|nr:MAG: hypothetical protein BEN19_01455 [Epulopiscium sp. Nuni2H_MBin003]
MDNKDGVGKRIQVRRLKTVFGKLFTVYLTFCLIIILIFSIIFSNRFHYYFIEFIQEMMVEQARFIANEYQNVDQIIANPEKAIEIILFRVETLNNYLGATTWIVDKKKLVNVLTKNYTSYTVKDEQVYNELLQTIFAGNVVKSQGVFKDSTDGEILTIGHPIIIGNQIYYILLIHAPLDYIYDILREINWLILNLLVISSIIVFMIIYLLSKHITIPLVEMNKVARQISNGEFDKRINVKGEDEVAQLGISLNNMANNLDKIEQNKNDFLSNITHDLRTPLTSIQGFVTAILDGTIPPDKTDKYLNIVLAETKRMINMTNSILELHKLQFSEIKVTKIAFDIHEMIKDVLTNLEIRVSEKNIKIQLFLEDKVQMVLADSEKIVRVVQNLLDNALKFVDEGGTIQIETVTDSNKLFVSIKNSGSKLTEEELKHIWNRFYKSDLSRSQEGMGLGLVIVKEIIQSHNEKICVTSDDMTTFCFSLERA